MCPEIILLWYIANVSYLVGIYEYVLKSQSRRIFKKYYTTSVQKLLNEISVDNCGAFVELLGTIVQAFYTD